MGIVQPEIRLSNSVAIGAAQGQSPLLDNSRLRGVITNTSPGATTVPGWIPKKKTRCATNTFGKAGWTKLSEARKVLPMYLLRQCVAAWDRKPVRGAFGTGGFDVADTGADANALALRVGPELYHIEKWRGSDEWTVSDSARYAGQVTVDNGISRLDYDAGGVDPIRGPIREWSRNTGQKTVRQPVPVRGQGPGR